MKTLPEYQAFFMKTPYGMDFKAMGANSYNVQAHIPRTDLQHYSQFVSQRFLSSYQRYSKEYEKYDAYQETYPDIALIPGLSKDKPYDGCGGEESKCHQVYKVEAYGGDQFIKELQPVSQQDIRIHNVGVILA